MREDLPPGLRRRASSAALAGLLMVAATACASGDDDAATSKTSSTSASAAGSDSPSETPSETEKVVEIQVSVRDGKVKPSPRRIEIEKDSQVRLLVTSDVDDELHVHGYEIEAELEAGRPTTVEFAADQTGLFEVETHESELELLQLEVR
jgi:heme/copper-type cytochrome/quinol oxidase subunit 2